MFKSILFTSSVFVFAGCATSFRSPVTGFLYNDTKAGLTASSNQTGNRIGEACVTSILGLVATGDASIETARRNGGVTMISSVDESVNSIMGVYTKYCSIVRGR